MTLIPSAIGCYSCADLEDWENQVQDKGYVIHINSEQIELCRDHRHNFKDLSKKSRQNKNIQITRLSKEFKTLKPQTILNEEKTSYILVYQPTEFEKDGKRDFANYPYFVTFNYDTNQKNVVYAYDNELKNRFKIDVLPEYDDIRWNPDYLNAC